MADNTTTQFRARATDAAGNTSACSNLAHLRRGLDSAGGPDDHRHWPGLAGQQQLPQVKGTAAAGTTVKIYASGMCLRITRGTGLGRRLRLPGHHGLRGRQHDDPVPR